MSLAALQQPLQLGDLTLKNRILMSALTRNRAIGTVPTSLVVKYYGQRTSAGLIISEGILIEPLGSEWSNAPGIWNEEQIKGWKKVTDEVHSKGGLIFAQLWHIGRVAHPFLQAGLPNVSASDVQAKGGKFRQLQGEPGYVKPKAIENPWDYIEKYRTAAKNALAAGFDGVEIHSANGYLPHQFIEAHSNLRTDEFGGTPEKRAKFVTEIVKAAVEVFGKKRVGVKLSPSGGYNDMGDPVDVLKANYTAVIKNLDALDIGYICITRYLAAFDPIGRGTPYDPFTFKPLIKNAYFFSNNGFTGEEANKVVEDGTVAAIQFGKLWITNPDLGDRLLKGQAVNTNFDFPTFYHNPQDDPENFEKGFTSYPRFEE